MFQKVLIAEDLDAINLAVQHVTAELHIATIHHDKYCDEALLKIRKALADNEPYDLLISDLSFKDDGKKAKLQTGEQLIDAVKQIQPNIKVLVYSVEDKNYRIKSLFDNQKINAFVLKSRDSIYQLKKAVQTIYNADSPYIIPELAHVIQDKTAAAIDEIDIQIIKHLATGIAQEDMENVFKQKGITPNSKSTIEKRVSKLKILFRANNTIHLIAITKDLGII